MNMKKLFNIIVLSCLTLSLNTFAQQFKAQHRPQFHFSPAANWMNDPNGMVYHKGVYHLFYQYYPDGTTWGPMHWGHAVSKDLVRWENKPIALFPDSLGYIFSGSAVVDEHNTTGFAKAGETPLVAIFTHHDPKGEREKKTTYQNQSLAYSLDDGETWVKYEGNPVLKNPGIVDFRDPKVMWYAPQKKWIMTLATKDRITFYSSPNLKDWNKESEFGANLGAHGGVWECPDLFPLMHNGKQVWVLLVSINPGGPNGGSATQYFTGSFDGKTFVPDVERTRFIDYGTDNYAGITWSNTGARKIFIGWMNNWQYANVVPTEGWRGATTLPRDLKIISLNAEYHLSSLPVKELKSIEQESYTKPSLRFSKELNLSDQIEKAKGQFKIDFTIDARNDFHVLLSSKGGDEITVGYESKKQEFYIDRTKAGKSDFEAGFAKRHTAPRVSKANQIKISLVADVASLELFADDGLSVMTDIFFPKEPVSKLAVISTTTKSIKDLRIAAIESIYQP